MSKGAGEQGRVTQGKPAHNPTLTHAPQHLCATALIALTYAVLDELHQELTPGLGFELADIGYDLVGMIAALGLIWVRERGRLSILHHPFSVFCFPQEGGRVHEH